MASYIYSIALDTSNGLLNNGALASSITASSINSSLNHVSSEGDVLTIDFASSLSSEDQSTLTSIIGSHDGSETPQETISQLVHLDNEDSSGKSMVAVDKPSGSFETTITHNWCDNTTWSSTSDSIWELTPGTGNKMYVVKAEVQFEHDLQISTNSRVLYLDYYAWHPSSPGTPILAERIEFDHIRKIFEYGNPHFHCPAINTEMPHGLSTVIFDYANKLTFYGDETFGELAFLKLSTKDNNAIDGTYATVGFVTRTESL